MEFKILGIVKAILEVFDIMHNYFPAAFDINEFHCNSLSNTHFEGKRSAEPDLGAAYECAPEYFQW